MRCAILIALCVAGTALANPRPFPGPPFIYPYLDLENLAVSISSTNATFTGTFKFNEEGFIPSAVRDDPQTRMLVQLPIWFPEKNSGDALVEKFWRTFPGGGTAFWNEDSPLAKEVLEDSIGLKILVSPSGLAKLAESYFISERYLSRYVSEDPGFVRLEVGFHLPAEVTWKRIPVTISYHHPLVRTNGVGRLYYAPYFDNLPQSISTADTNRYAITIEATPDCSLTVTTGDQKFSVEGGHRITLAPKAGQPIRVTSKPLPHSAK